MTSTLIAPPFGLQFIRQDDQAVPVIGSNLDVVGIIGPCSTANSARFPFNTPVLVFSNDTTLGADLGTDGYIPDAINAINSQLADSEVAAQMVIVRTPYGANVNPNIALQQTIANIMGNSLSGTGVWAFLDAPNTLYCTPRLICAPGYTGQMANSLDLLHCTTPGTGYIPGGVYNVNFVQGAGETNGAQLVLPQAEAIANSDGTITDASLTILSFGAWMTASPTATVPAPDGPPIVAQAASGQILFVQQPGIGSTLKFGTTNITFVSGTPTALQVQIGASLSATLNNLLTFLQASVDPQISQCTYTLNGATLNIVDKTAGTTGNGFGLGSTVYGVTLSDVHLDGGINAASSTQAVLTTALALGANPVVAALAGGPCNALRAHAIVESPGSSMISDENWRDTIDSQRIIPMSGGVKIQDPLSGNIIVMPVAPRIIGAIIARDFATGFPFHSAANTPIQNIVGPARTIAFNLEDGATEGQQLIAANLGIIVRGQIGVETAISSGGFVYIGTDNAGSDPLWQMYNVTRGRDYIELSLMPALRTYLGRSNIDRQTVTNVIGTVNAFLKQLTAMQQILGYSTSFQGSLNSVAEIRLGHIVISFAAEEPPVLKRITTMSARYRPAIDALIADLAANLNFAG